MIPIKCYFSTVLNGNIKAGTFTVPAFSSSETYKDVTINFSEPFHDANYAFNAHVRSVKTSGQAIAGITSLSFVVFSMLENNITIRVYKDYTGTVNATEWMYMALHY